MIPTRACAPALVAGALAMALVSPEAVVAKEAPIGLVVVYLGGPDTGTEGKKMIDQLIEHLSGAMGVEPTTLDGSYFNETEPALAHLKKNKEAFILGSLGFYLAHRKSLGLTPLALLKSSGDITEREYVVVKKGKYKSLDDLKGKALYGSPLFEDLGFLNRVVFAGKLDAAKHFELKPTSRPLTAVRKLDKEEIDAVLLNTVQYESLRRMPLFENLAVVFSSEAEPALGLMATDTPRVKAMRDKLVKAVVEMCSTPKGLSMCQNFGINGFEPMKPGALDATIKTYEGGG